MNYTNPDDSNDTVATHKSGMTRREMLLGIFASVGAISVSGKVIGIQSDSLSASFYSAQQLKLVSILCDLIIPKTQTLGALDVGVPMLMNNLYAVWANKTSQQEHTQALKHIEDELNNSVSASFIDASTKEQVSALASLDKRAYTTGQRSEFYQYRGIKSLIARFYYLSEEGATKELRYEAVPGRWEASVEFSKIGKTWAA